MKTKLNVEIFTKSNYPHYSKDVWMEDTDEAGVHSSFVGGLKGDCELSIKGGAYCLKVYELDVPTPEFMVWEKKIHHHFSILPTDVYIPLVCIGNHALQKKFKPDVFIFLHDMCHLWSNLELGASHNYSIAMTKLKINEALDDVNRIDPNANIGNRKELRPHWIKQKVYIITKCFACGRIF